ncbi:hypothetical protein bpr_I2285 [Butyrivibrio proteoclasticus B316]|uniref:Uncharacterized protein n=2 Tax=Butyrivibrio proteoclasticus TaxID=43305 RepID=E0RY63_BUTPB|nr:hypothetical protein bpr_I2285 [Butyrivibrio proteoclasticus B316]
MHLLPVLFLRKERVMKKICDCVDGNMDVLMYDNTIKKVRDLCKDDIVYSVSYDGEDLTFTRGTILEVNRRKSSAVRITLSDGRILISSPCHQWLSQSGWLLTYDDSEASNSFLFLQENTYMQGIYRNIPLNIKESKLYMAGYLIGVEVFGKSLVPLRGGEYADFVSPDIEVTRRVYNYYKYFGVETSLSDFCATNLDTNEIFATKKLKASYKDVLKLSEKYVVNKENEEFRRGFVAGLYDSAGTVNPIKKSLKSLKKDFLEILEKGLKQYDFDYSYRSEFWEGALLGGAPELIRFYNIFKPVNKLPVENIEASNIHQENNRIVSIEEIRSDNLYEIVTTSRNFIANGIVTHDCAVIDQN